MNLIHISRPGTPAFFFRDARVETIWYNALSQEALWIFHDSWTALFPLLRTIQLS